LYDDSLFFKTLLENGMMMLAKLIFPSNGLHEKDPSLAFGKLFMMNF
jgi:hypothetical protein